MTARLARLALLGAPLLGALAGCGGGPDRIPANAAPAPVTAACQEAADRDPAYQRALAISAGNLDWQWQHGPQVEAIRKSAIARCMGVTRGYRGGIEGQRP